MSPSYEQQLLNVLYEHLQRLSLAQTSPGVSNDAADRLAYATALISVEDLPQGHASGGLGAEHLESFGKKPLGSKTEQRLSDQLDHDLIEVAEFYYTDSALSRDGLRERADNLVQDVEKEQQTQEDTIQETLQVIENILELVAETNEVRYSFRRLLISSLNFTSA